MGVYVPCVRICCAKMPGIALSCGMVSDHSHGQDRRSPRSLKIFVEETFGHGNCHGRETVPEHAETFVNCRGQETAPERRYPSPGAKCAAPCASGHESGRKVSGARRGSDSIRNAGHKGRDYRLRATGYRSFHSGRTYFVSTSSATRCRGQLVAVPDTGQAVLTRARSASPGKGRLVTNAA